MGTNQVRYGNVALGIWLFISAFVWRHSQAQFTNTWIMGVIVTAVAVLALSYSRWRHVNTAAGVWLVISGFVLPRLTAGTTWNNVIVGILVFLISLAPARGQLMHPRRAAT
jgi:hypothetical protein